MGKPPGRLNVELASLANAILADQKKTLTQVELYAALQAVGADVPKDLEAFRLWCTAPESRAWSHAAGLTLILDHGFRTRDWHWGQSRLSPHFRPVTPVG